MTTVAFLPGDVLSFLLSAAPPRQRCSTRGCFSGVRECLIAAAAIGIIAVYPSYGETSGLALAQDPKPTASSLLKSQTTAITVSHTVCLGSLISQLDGKALGLSISDYSTPNGIYYYELVPYPTGIVGLSLNIDGPFTDTLVVPIAVEGGGGSTRFFIDFHSIGTVNIPAPCEQDGRAGCMRWWNPETSTWNGTNLELTSAWVTSVKLSPINGTLDENPNIGGGWRIFPGWDSPFLPIDNASVLVEATTSHPGLEVWFESYDLDDPSGNSRPVDSNRSDGNDNRGGPQLGWLSSLYQTSTATEAGNVAQVQFQTTIQPGDNFRLAASCDLRYLNTVSVAGTDLADGEGQILPTARAQITDMLTVWRRLHIEVDSMGLVAGNYLTGRIATCSDLCDPASCGGAHVKPSCRPVTYKGSDSVIKLAAPLGIDNVGRFEEGNVIVGDDPSEPTLAQSYRVKYNSEEALTVYGNVPPSLAGLLFILYDDDNMGFDAITNGDDGEDVPAPDLRFLQDSDNPNVNKFAPAYIRPTYHVVNPQGVYGQTTFYLNTPAATNEGLIDTYEDSDYAAAIHGEMFDQSMFWYAYLLGGYQYAAAKDNDPTREDAPMGVTDSELHIGSTVFMERMYDAPEYWNVQDGGVCSAMTAVHEIGHLFGLEHGGKGVMTTMHCDEAGFSNSSLDVIRWAAHP